MGHPIGLVADILHSMATAAHFGAALRVQAGRIDDSLITVRAGVLGISAHRMLIAFNVLISRPVTRLTCNPQFGYFCFEDRSPRILQRFAGRGVAPDTAPIPDLH